MSGMLLVQNKPGCETAVYCVDMTLNTLLLLEKPKEALGITESRLML